MADRPDGPPAEPIADRWRRLPGITAVPDTGAVALTFDDGPDADATPAVLDALEAAGATATFFMLGEQLVRHHAIAREVVARGHEAALHGFSHAAQPSLAPAAVRDELDRAVWAFETILGCRPAWFRPPYGLMSDAGHAHCLELGMRPVYWSALGRDWQQCGPSEIAAAVDERLAGGAIVLLHDSARYAERASAQPTAAAVPLVAERAAARGLSLGTVGALAAPGPLPVPQP